MNPDSWLDINSGLSQHVYPEPLASSPPKDLPQHDSPLWLVSSDDPRSLEQLALDANISFSEALSEATLLELQGWLTHTLGGLYQRAHGQ